MLLTAEPSPQLLVYLSYGASSYFSNKLSADCAGIFFYSVICLFDYIVIQNKFQFEYFN